MYSGISGTAAKLVRRSLPTSKKERRLIKYNPNCKKLVDILLAQKLADANEGAAPIKARINLMFAREMVINSRKTNKYRVWYMDGGSGRTSQVLLGAGYTRRELIPITNDLYAARHIRRVIGENMIPMNFSDRIKSLRCRGVSGIWYDGCATLRGSKTSGVSPIEDITELLNKRKLDNTVLAVTFSTRSRSKVGSIKLLENTIASYNYKFEKLSEISYIGPMCFWMALLKKI